MGWLRSVVDYLETDTPGPLLNLDRDAIRVVIQELDSDGHLNRSMDGWEVARWIKENGQGIYESEENFAAEYCLEVDGEAIKALPDYLRLSFNWAHVWVALQWFDAMHIGARVFVYRIDS